VAGAADWLLGRGRLPRMPYTIGFIGTVGVTVGLVLGSVIAFYDFGYRRGPSYLEDAWIFGLVAAALWVLSVLVIRRLHDMNCAGWHVLWIGLMTLAGVLSGGGFWSILALLMHAFLMLNPGRPEPNRFGPAAGTPEAA